MSIILPLTSM